METQYMHVMLEKTTKRMLENGAGTFNLSSSLYLRTIEMGKTVNLHT